MIQVGRNENKMKCSKDGQRKMSVQVAKDKITLLPPSFPSCFSSLSLSLCIFEFYEWE